MIPYSDVHVGRLEKAGKFPKRIALGPGRNGWSLRELMAYIEEKKRQRDALAAQADQAQDANEQLVVDQSAADHQPTLDQGDIATPEPATA